MPINTDLNIAPYFDDFDQENQFYRVLFKPGYAVQARELTQLQSILQNQVETFGDNIFKEGSIVKGCTFTNLDQLQYVKLTDKTDTPFDAESFISKTVVENILGVDTEVEIVYEVVGDVTGLKAEIIQAARGFETRPPNLNTFFINYLTTNEASNYKVFQPGELLKINRYRYIGDSLDQTELDIQRINVTQQSGATGKSFGIQASPGVIFQKGNFLFTEAQTVIVEKYSDVPDLKSIGYEVDEKIIAALQDSTLYDNANGSTNENAPGADRLKLTPNLVVKETAVADADADFFTLARYVEGNAVALRDVSQYNALGNEMARRTYEESGNYIVNDFKSRSEKRGGLTKVVCNPGVAYIKGFRVENGGEQSFTIDNIANTDILENQPVSIDYGNYVPVTDIRGTVDLDFTEADLEEAGTVIGKTFIRNLTQDRIYLFGSRITTPGKTFADVTQIDSTAGRILIANNAVIKDASKATMIFPTGAFSVKGTTDITVPIRAVETGVTITSNQFTLTNGGGIYDYDCNNDDVVVVDSLNENRSVTSAVAQTNDSELLVTVGGAASGTATVYVNKRIQLTTPYNKSARTPYIKISYSSSESRYSLGFPDVYKIMSIVDGNGVDFTDSFRLHTNQKDAYYDISFIEYIPGRPRPANGTLTIQMGVFQLNPSSGSYFFTINSYPIDDDSETLPAGKVRSEDLIVYTNANGSEFNLRECVDFRPHVDKDSNADYSQSNPASAPTITATPDGVAPAFSRSDYLIPAFDESMNLDIEVYNARIDLLTVDSYGKISLVKGEEAVDPAPPKIGKDTLAVSEILIPGYPALSAYEADRAKKPAYAIRTRSFGTKRFTMADIGSIAEKVDRLEYYVQLNQLEKATENLDILDENGLSRFKNGYIADPFNNLNLSDMEDVDFNAAVPFDRKELTPRITTFPLDLKYKSSTSATVFPTTAIADSGTLSRNAHVSIIGQPFATNFRSCVSNFYFYKGVGQLSPQHDFGVDTVVNPVPATIDISGPIQDFADAIQEFLPLTGTTTRDVVIANQQGRARDLGFNRGGMARVTTVERTTTSRSLEFNEQDQVNQVGDFVSNVEFNPFIRPQEVKIYMAGLRPNTRHYFFFDGENVDAHVSPGTPAVNNARDIKLYGEKEDAVTTDANGVLRAVFNIPSETFYVGERKLEVADVDQYDSIESGGSSSGKVSYHAYNIAVEQQALQTRVPEIDVGTSVTTRNVQLRPQFFDPLAQTFFIKEGMGKGSGTVMISKVDLYFKRKSAVNGCTVELREVVNGYPSNRIIPFSQVDLTPSDVNVSDDSSVVTTVDFPAPVRLEVETEYAIVIRPHANDPGYLVFTSKVGGTDLTPGDTQGQTVVQDWGDGVLFTSTNNKAWKSYQDEDLKFTLYRHDFNASTGSITLTNNDHEFFTLEDWDGAFETNEIVYAVQDRDGNTASAISMPIGSKIITGTDLDDTYSAGDFVLVSDSGGSTKDIFEIESVDSATQMTTVNPTPFAGVTAEPVTAGRASYHNFRRPETLHLSGSSATTTFPFAANTDIVGLSSGTTATILTVDDINLSYVQPMIQKTNDSVTRTGIQGLFVDTANENRYYEHPMKFGDANYFTKNGVVLYSKSNNLSGQKPFDITINLENGSNSTSSPFIDIETSMLLANQYQVTNSSDTTAKYISKSIELAESLDAEDLQLILTGYKPQGTDIKVYIRPQHAYDSANFNSIDWIELEIIEGARTFSSSTNSRDYKEFKYAVPDSAKDSEGVIEYTSSAGDFKGYRKFAIRIELLSPNIHQVPTVADYRAVALT